MQRFDAPYPDIPARLHVLAVLVFTFLIFSAYANSLDAGFALDSRGRILNDPRITAINKNNLTLIFTENYWWPRGYTNLYRPVTALSYMVNRAILFNPEDPAGYRVFNVLLHVVNAYLLYLAALLLMRAWWPAMLTASLWALHPVCTESVTNIVGRADELSMMAVVGALLLYVRARGAQGLNRWWWRVALMLTTLVGLLAKEIAAVIPGVVLLYDVACRRLSDLPSSERRDLWKRYLVFAPPFLVAWYLRAATFAHGGPMESPFVDNPVQGSGFLTGRLTAIKVIGKYIWLLLWPVRQSCDYSYNQVPLFDWRLTRLEDWKALSALVCLFLLMAAAVALFRFQKNGFFFLGLLGLTLLPVSNLIIPIGTIMAERLLYLPAAGFAGCVVLAVYGSARQHRKAAAAVLATIVVLAGVRTYARNLDWADDETLWAQAVKASPDSFKTHLGLAEVRLFTQPLAVALDGAIKEEEEALRIVAGLPLDKAPNNVFAELGELYRLKGELAAPKNSGGTAVPSAESLIWYGKALRVLSRGAAIDRAVAAAMHRQELAGGKPPTRSPRSVWTGCTHRWGSRTCASGMCRRRSPRFSISAGWTLEVPPSIGTSRPHRWHPAASGPPRSRSSRFTS